jgi:hypothetical protein
VSAIITPETDAVVLAGSSEKPLTTTMSARKAK